MRHEADVGIVVALGIEAAPIRERLVEAVRFRGHDREVTIGSLGRAKVALIAAGVGREAATRGTRLLIDGHSPRTIIAAGLCGGLDPSLARGTLVLADSVRLGAPGPSVETMPFDGPSRSRITTPTAVGAILTSEKVVTSPEAKRSLYDSTGAVAVDMESWWVVEEGRRAGLPVHVIRAVCDTAGEPVAADIASLAAAGHPARLAGAAIRLLWRRPAAIGELAELRERAHEAVDLLAAGLEAILSL